MKSQRYLTLGLLLTACAGFVDAIGFIELGGFYTSFMSGNTTQLGTGAIRADLVLLPLGLVVMFFLGSLSEACWRSATPVGVRATSSLSSSSPSP